MTDESVGEAREQAESIAAQVPPLLERVVEKLGANAGARAVFGEPVERDGLTVIPVAQSIIGSGAGGGGDAGGPESGVGGGGGALTRPLGYIEVGAGGASFVPLTQPWTDAKLVLAYTLLALVLSRMIVKLVRG